MLSWIEFVAVGVAIGIGGYFAIIAIWSILTWRYEKYKQIADFCDKINDAFEARDNE